MTPDPLQAQRLTTRIIAFALWMANAIYLGLLAFVVLKGELGGFLAPLSGVPWTNPLVAVLAGLGAMTPVPALLLRRILLARAAAITEPMPRLLQERNALIIPAALFESVGIYGLLLGFAVGPATAPLGLLLLLVPLAAIPFLLPPHARFGDGDGIVRR
jgi:hypothetical protein